jgi:uncharacterized protein YdcH (DUF465 family)
VEPITLALAAIAGIKQGIALYKDAKATGSDLYKVTKEISGFIGQFFEAHEEVKKEVKRQELNPPKEKSLKAQALENVFNQIELERQAVEMKEFLIYHTDPALGAVWSRYEAEFARLAKKHEEEIKQEVIAERNRKWQRQKRLNKLADEALILGAVLVVVLEMWALMYAIHRSRDM